MGIVTGKVVEGKVLVDGMTLPEGAVVTVVTGCSDLGRDVQGFEASRAG